MAADSADTNVVQAIQKSGALFAETLHQFRVCHELLVNSGLFSKQEILDMDTCAISFRDLGLKTTTLASVTSSVWLGGIIMYYENLSYFDDDATRKTKERQMRQAADLSKAFRVISAWASSLSKQFHKTGTDSIAESQEIVKRFDSALAAAQAMQQKAEANSEAVTKKYEAAKEDAAKKHVTLKVLESAAYNLIGVMSTASVANEVADADGLVRKTQHLKEVADERLKEANEKLKAAQTSKQKAQVVASKVADLLEVLTAMASTCQVIATYWTTESARFLTDCRSSTAVVASQDNLAFWKGAKSEFDTYKSVMTSVTNQFNFTTDARLPPQQTLHFQNLAFELRVPASLNVKDL